jgi:hypothetical protein
VEQILNDRPIGCEIAHVGKLVTEPGLWQKTPEGQQIPLEATGWRHE